MSVTISIRNQSLELHEVEQLRAVRADRMLEKTSMVVSLLKSLKSGARRTAEKLLADNSRAVFESAGWVFADNTETVHEAARSLTRQPPETAVHRVFADNEGELYVETSRLVVRMKASLKKATALDRMAERFRPIRRLAFAPNLFEVGTYGAGALDVLQTGRSDGVEYLEPQLLQRIQGRVRPTDPQYRRQWQWNNVGSSGGVPGADVGAEQAWDVTLGRGVRVAVIDNGMQLDHPDLQQGIQAGGYFEDDGAGSGPFVRREDDPGNFPHSDHGTFCMGMVGARMNNERGGCGGAPESLLLPIACLNDQIGTQTTLARAIAYAADPTTEDASAAADQGADVISCSLGPNGAHWTMFQVLQDAIEFAVNSGRSGRGTPIFWAASNGNVPIETDQVCSYPATIAVGRSSRMDLEDGSAFGSQLEFLAPGVEVFSTRERSAYGTSTGTSFAAPCAASVAALVLSREPDLTWEQVRDRLRASCDKVGTVGYEGDTFDGRNDRYGYGRVNAARAVTFP